MFERWLFAAHFLRNFSSGSRVKSSDKFRQRICLGKNKRVSACVHQSGRSGRDGAAKKWTVPKLKKKGAETWQPTEILFDALHHLK